MVRRFIPNFFTLLNLFSGCIAAVLATQNQLVFAALFVGIGVFFDFFDGFFARLLNVRSKLGLQLDTLADMVTSGLVPGIVMMQLLVQSIDGNPDNFINNWSKEPNFRLGFPPLALFGFLITLSSAYRLAKFNIDKRQSTSFFGLPAPANAVLVLSLPLILVYQPSDEVNYLLLNPWFLSFFTLISSFLLNAELPMFSLKIASYKFRTNWYRYVFLALSLLALLTLGFIALPLIILIYLLLSVILFYLEEDQ